MQKSREKGVDAHRTRVLHSKDATGSYQLPAAAQHLTLPGLHGEIIAQPNAQVESPERFFIAACEVGAR
jgi:hypothetical protein